MKSEDAELVNLSLNGDREAFSALISRYQQIVCTIALKRTGDYGQAQDIAQEAFLEAYLHLESLREPKKFANWIAGITRNLVNRWLISQQRELISIENLVYHEEKTGEPIRPLVSNLSPQTPEQLYEEKEESEGVWKAIKSLPTQLRETILLYYIDGYSYHEISNLLGIPETTVRGRLYQGRQKLKRRMTEMLGETSIEESIQKKIQGLLKKAREEFNNEVALIFYQQGLAHLDGLSEDLPDERREIHEGLGDVYTILGEFQLAIDNDVEKIKGLLQKCDT